jgi:HlyD family secretion protein
MAAMTIKKPNKFSKTAIRVAITIAVLAGMIAGGYFIYTRYFSTQTSTTEENPLQTTKAAKGNLVLYADGTGTIIPQEESALGFNASGQVKEIDVKVGDTAEAGQVLAQLDDAQAQIQLIEAQDAMNALTTAAAIATAKQTLATA